MTFHFTMLITLHLPVLGKLRGKSVLFPWNADSRQAFGEAFHGLPAGGSVAPHSCTPLLPPRLVGDAAQVIFPFSNLRSLPSAQQVSPHYQHLAPSSYGRAHLHALLLSPKEGFR